MNVSAVFRSPPRFHLGQNVLLRYEEKRKRKKVAQCNLFGIVTGIRFCPEESEYVGWIYDLQAYKLIIDGELKYPNAEHEFPMTAECEENSLEPCDEEVDILTIIDNIYFRKELMRERFNW